MELLWVGLIISFSLSSFAMDNEKSAKKSGGDSGKSLRRNSSSDLDIKEFSKAVSPRTPEEVRTFVKQSVEEAEDEAEAASKSSTPESPIPNDKLCKNNRQISVDNLVDYLFPQNPLINSYGFDITDMKQILNEMPVATYNTEVIKGISPKDIEQKKGRPLIVHRFQIMRVIIEHLVKEKKALSETNLLKSEDNTKNNAIPLVESKQQIPSSTLTKEEKKQLVEKMKLYMSNSGDYVDFLKELSNPELQNYIKHQSEVYEDVEQRVSQQSLARAKEKYYRKLCIVAGTGCALFFIAALIAAYFAVYEDIAPQQ